MLTVGETHRPARRSSSGRSGGSSSPLPRSGRGSGTRTRGSTGSQVEVEPTLDAEIQPLGDAEVTGMYERYRNRYGDFPSVDADVSRDQLAALSQVLAAHAVPYADFSIFGPHGQRLLRRQTFQSYSLNVSTGEWAKKEQPGPGSFYEWYKAWRCYRTALLLLEAAEAERLDAYAEHIRGLSPNSERRRGRSSSGSPWSDAVTHVRMLRAHQEVVPFPRTFGTFGQAAGRTRTTSFPS